MDETTEQPRAEAREPQHRARADDTRATAELGSMLDATRGVPALTEQHDAYVHAVVQRLAAEQEFDPTLIAFALQLTRDPERAHARRKLGQSLSRTAH